MTHSCETVAVYPERIFNHRFRLTFPLGGRC